MPGRGVLIFKIDAQPQFISPRERLIIVNPADSNDKRPTEIVLYLKHKLKLNLGVDYLVFVQSNMSYQVKPDEGITTVNNNWGVKDGLNKIDFRLGVGYEWQFSNRFAFQANASYGFLDRTDNTFMMNSISDHEMNVTIGLKYTFFRKI